MIVALVGRPNVGKSRLFNRMIGRRRSLVWNQPGVTRDLLKDKFVVDGKSIELWDLAGWGKFGLSFQNLDPALKKKIDLILLVVDGSEPLNSEDMECLRSVRKANRKLFVVINKSDKKSFEDNRSEILEHMGSQSFEIAAETGAGVSDLVTTIADLIPNADIETEPAETLSDNRRSQVLILGRPNVGKSSLMNRLANEDVSFVSSLAGTTRDTLSHSIQHHGKEWKFLDSAGVRKKSKVYGRKADPLEIFSIEKALKSLKTCRACLFLVEAQPDGRLHTQDKKLLSLVRDSLVPTILIVNKWDLVRKKFTEKDYRASLRYDLADLDYMPILFISALTNFHIPKVIQLVEDLMERIKPIATSKLNKWLQIVLKTKPPRVAKKGVTSDHFRSQTQYLHIQYAVHSNLRPMTFQFFCNAPHAVAEDDRRFLTKRLRQDFHLSGLPIKTIFRKKN